MYMCVCVCNEKYSILELHKIYIKDVINDEIINEKRAWGEKTV